MAFGLTLELVKNKLSHYRASVQTAVFSPLEKVGWFVKKATEENLVWDWHSHLATSAVSPALRTP